MFNFFKFNTTPYNSTHVSSSSSSSSSSRSSQLAGGGAVRKRKKPSAFLKTYIVRFDLKGDKLITFVAKYNILSKVLFNAQKIYDVLAKKLNISTDSIVMRGRLLTIDAILKDITGIKTFSAFNNFSVSADILKEELIKSNFTGKVLTVSDYQKLIKGAVLYHIEDKSLMMGKTLYRHNASFDLQGRRNLIDIMTLLDIL